MAESSEQVGEGSHADAPKQGSTPPNHPLIDKLLAHKPGAKDVVEIVGYLGPSPKAETFRVYPRLDLRGYFEIPEGSLIHHVPVDASDPSGPSRVLIAGSTQLEMVQVVDAQFLRGSIASAHPLASSSPSDRDPCGTVKQGPPPTPTSMEHFEKWICPPPPTPTGHEHHEVFAKPPPPPPPTPTTSNH